MTTETKRCLYIIWLLSCASSALATFRDEFAIPGRALEQATNRTYNGTVTRFFCPSDCSSDEFCGSDLQCHRYSCESWYQWGPPTFTRYDPAVSEPLTCVDIARGQEDVSFLSLPPYCGNSMPVAVEFIECGRDSGSTSCPSKGSTVAHMNRKCTAQPSLATGFVCYDVSDNTDLETYFAEYLSASKELESEPCRNSSLATWHSYNGVFFAPNYGAFSGPGSTNAFNASLAASSIISGLFEVPSPSELKFPLCQPGCKDSEFCGQDGACYTYNCENMYARGPVEVTGHAEGDDGVLVCTDVPEEEKVCALQYECRPDGLNSILWDAQCPSNDVVSLQYNRYCTASPNADQSFTCSEFAPDTDIESYVQEYLSNTTSISCNGTYTSYFFELEIVGYHNHRFCSLTTNRKGRHFDCRYPSFSGWKPDAIDVDRLRFSLYTNLKGDRQEDTESSATNVGLLRSATHILLATLTFFLL